MLPFSVKDSIAIQFIRVYRHKPEYMETKNYNIMIKYKVANAYKNEDHAGPGF